MRVRVIQWPNTVKIRCSSHGIPQPQLNIVAVHLAFRYESLKNTWKVSLVESDSTLVRRNGILPHFGKTTVRKGGEQACLLNAMNSVR